MALPALNVSEPCHGIIPATYTQIFIWYIHWNFLHSFNKHCSCLSSYIY